MKNQNNKLKYLKDLNKKFETNKNQNKDNNNLNIIIDYGMGNLASLKYACDRVGLEVVISSDINTIKNAKSLILPGVGSFYEAMKNLEKANLVEVIKEKVANNTYLLGICLGMQLLYDKSYENGEARGLGLIEGEIKLLDISLKVPHMGWNSLDLLREDPILKYTKKDDYVYFIHSFYAVSSGKEFITTSDYEVKIPGIVRKNNIYGIQFHPEKSGKVGENILRAYKEMIE